MKRMRTMWVLAMVVGPFMATASMAQTPTIEKIELLGLNRVFGTGIGPNLPKLHSNGERTELTEGARIPIGDYAVEVTFADNDGLDKIATVQFRWYHDSLPELPQAPRSYHETVGYPDNNRGRPDRASGDPKGTPPALTTSSLLGCGFEMRPDTLNIKYYHRCMSLADQPAGRSTEAVKLEITWVLWAGGARQPGQTVNFRMVRAGATALDTDGATDNGGDGATDNEGDDNADNEGDDNADNEGDDNADNEGDDNADNEGDDNADNEGDDNDGDDNDGDDNARRQRRRRRRRAPAAAPAAAPAVAAAAAAAPAAAAAAPAAVAVTVATPVPPTSRPAPRGLPRTGAGPAGSWSCPRTAAAWT